jgi:methylated-DNA-[protein]-cysteine S-methyltransferase
MIAKQPERLILERLPTPIGEGLIVTDETGVLRAFNWAEYEAAMRRGLEAHYGHVPLQEGRTPGTVRRAFEAYFAGDVRALEGLAWATGGTDFQRSVWTALCTIPAGETVSYQELARRIGNPRAVRAVGLANGQNPIAIMAPCHRVIGADRSLTGYGGGLDRKRWLLRHEGAAFKDAPGREARAARAVQPQFSL